jgi:DNA polymerase-4
VAWKIQDAVREQVREWMCCSIGLGPNIFLAKVASDLQKPRGHSVITLADIPHKLLRLALTDWPGISKAWKP